MKSLQNKKMFFSTAFPYGIRMPLEYYFKTLSNCRLCRIIFQHTRNTLVVILMNKVYVQNQKKKLNVKSQVTSIIIQIYNNKTYNTAIVSSFYVDFFSEILEHHKMKLVFFKVLNLNLGDKISKKIPVILTKRK